MAKKTKIISKFKEIKAKGYVKSRRINDTGIGKTFEDYLGVAENNISDSDFEGFEVKAHRRESNSYITLFTQSPSSPKGANSALREQYGKPEGLLGVKTVRTSVFGNKWNSFNEQYAFRFYVKETSVDLYVKKISGSNKTLLCSWDMKVLREKFKNKLRSLFFVKADKKVNSKGQELFHFTEATVYNKPDFSRFIQLANEGKIMIDIRLGIYSSGKNNGKAHDHGTGFRIMGSNLSELYKEVFVVE